jgi:peptidoglycan L-alanyl-D-glutamate endopeptidase CwlK
MADKGIGVLTPRMREKIQCLQDGLKNVLPGTDFRRSWTLRTPAEQEALYMQGREPLDVVNRARKAVKLAPITEKENEKPVTWTTKSAHKGGEAVDYFIQQGGKYCTDLKADTNEDHIPDWEEFGRIADECGLDWGGNWKKPDFPHIQWKD